MGAATRRGMLSSFRIAQVGNTAVMSASGNIVPPRLLIDVGDPCTAPGTATTFTVRTTLGGGTMRPIVFTQIGSTTYSVATLGPLITLSGSTGVQVFSGLSIPLPSGCFIGLWLPSSMSASLTYTNDSFATWGQYIGGTTYDTTAPTAGTTIDFNGGISTGLRINALLSS